MYSIAKPGDERFNFLVKFGPAAQALDPAFGDRPIAQRCAQDGAQHRAAVTIVAAHIRVSDQGGFEIVRVARPGTALPETNARCSRPD